MKDIRRQDFTKPEREDEYGTSVISIQVLKEGGFISIKNRYNHKVNSPDNTFNSNPDNIIYGLSESIKHHFNVDFSSHKEQLPDYFTEMNKQILKYNYEVNNTYFGENFYAKDSVVHELDKSKELMLDYLVLDLQSKEIKNPSGGNDGLIEALKQEIQGDDKKLQVKVNEAGNKTLVVNGVEILELEQGKIVSLNLPNVTEIESNFLQMNEVLREVSLPNVTRISENFLHKNKELRKVSLPNVTEIESGFLFEHPDKDKLNPLTKKPKGQSLNDMVSRSRD